MDKTKTYDALRLSAFALVAFTGIALADAAQQSFSTPEQAVDALIAANRSGSKADLLKVLGPNGEKLISSGDAAADKENRDAFVAAYDAGHSLESVGDAKKIVIVGTDNWPLPIPLVRKNNQWQFDTAAGEQEIIDRRIGRNELSVIEVCRAYVEAQHDYAASHNAEYADKFADAKGSHNALYWPAAPGEQESPLGPLIASAQADDGTGKAQPPVPYHGYYYKILTQQGAHAAGGAMNYVNNGHMTGGFALVAFPASYNDSGIMTFIVNQNGIVYEKTRARHGENRGEDDRVRPR